MKNITLLVDAQNLLKMAFHGDSTTFTKFGYMGAVKTFYMKLRKSLINLSELNLNVNKCILFWDGERSGKLRYDIYPEYKSNRKKDWHGEGIILTDREADRENNGEKTLFDQRLRVKRYAEEFFLRQVEDPICEADDCMAYYVQNHVKPDEMAVMMSADNDFCMLVSDNVYFYILDKNQIVNKNNYHLYFDHHQSNASLIKAIEGCKSDVIHGVENMGEKTLLKLFPELRIQPVTFDHIYNRAIEINKGRKKPLVALTNLIEGKTSIENSCVITGKHLFELNHKLVNLLEPFMTEEAKETVEAESTYPISDVDRGGKNLLRLMYEDGFINLIPGGAERFSDFIKVFLPIVKKEKEDYTYYLKKNKNF